MSSTKRIIIAVCASAVLAGVIRLLWVKKTTKKMLDQVADEGYETAADILYPDTKRLRRQRYGPVWRA